MPATSNDIGARAGIRPEILSMLRCPETGARLVHDGDCLRSEDGRRTYPLTSSGIPLFGARSHDGLRQQAHYDRIAALYLENLRDPHSDEYLAYLDRALLGVVGATAVTRLAELCCGAGEGLALLGDRVRFGIGVDVSTMMLEAARARVTDDTRLFVQADATCLPLADAAFDAVVTIGGIHHVNDRVRLFTEVSRVLASGGTFVWREPVDDFAPWRSLRRFVYGRSLQLEADTEHPLRRADTERQLAAAGLRLDVWRPIGFVGYAALMNGDVVAINRLWRFVPGVRALTRAAAWLDDAALRLPRMARGGALVIGRASKR